VFFECDWFDPINGTRVDDFGMVEVKHESCYSGNNILLAHQVQQVHNVNPKMHTHRYEEYVEGQKDEDVVDVHQEEPIEH
jgi:hypothetical protein